MRKITSATTGARAGASPQWKTLETFAREEMQHFLQRVLEEEVRGCSDGRRGNAARPTPQQGIAMAMASHASSR